MMQITVTTDSKFVGQEFENDALPVLDGVEFVPEKVIQVSDKEWRLVTSNYIIDVKEV